MLEMGGHSPWGRGLARVRTVPRPAGGPAQASLCFGARRPRPGQESCMHPRGPVRPRQEVLPWFSHRMGAALLPTEGMGATRLRPTGNCRGRGVTSPLPPEASPGTPGRRAGHQLTTLGLKGGWISRFSSFSQSILRKKACSRTSRSPSGPQPSRFPGCLVIS